MSLTNSADEDALIAQALRSASDTRLAAVRAGIRHEAAAAFATQFGDQPAIVIADEYTFSVGKDVCASFSRANHPLQPPFIFGPHVYADDRCALELEVALKSSSAIPVAVGSGTINDLTKLAAHRAGRPYMALATAASMDGYTAYGASITAKGSKQTFDCPAPRAVLADLEVIAAAPSDMNASGYADLLAKVAAGADWILADALGIEPIDESVWVTVQKHLPEWISEPANIAKGEPTALRRLMIGLLMSGFAMQAARSSRPASGADHQFSHLWDMQHHTHRGIAPSHGFKVGIGTLASIALYEELLRRDLSSIDIDAAAASWPPLEELHREIAALFEPGELAAKAIEETEAKYISPAALRKQLERLSGVWPDLRAKLKSHLLPFDVARAMLKAAGCPVEPEQIGISRSRLRQSYRQALFIRRRFTVLDLAHRTMRLEACLQSLFGPEGAWRESRTGNSEETALAKLAAVRHLVLDLDGTLYRGNRLFDVTLPFLDKLRSWGLGYTLLTNNTSRSKADYVEKLGNLGIEATENQIYTPADSTIAHLRKNLPQVSAIAVLGTPSLCLQFESAGFQVTWESPQAVIVGFDMTLTYDRLCRAAYWISRGLPYIATHPDLVCPTDEPTVLVDCGAICACLSAATGKSPLVLGKPDPRILRELGTRLGLSASELAMVGDRIYTDMAMAQEGALAVLVLSGEATAEQAAAMSVPPDLVVADVGELGRRMQETRRTI